MYKGSAEIHCQSVTPIWTGDVNADASKEIIATSVLGGMRWWYEALCRGVMARIPDPTGPSRLRYEAAKGKLALDPASRLFGATGWRRRFRLEITMNNTRPARIEQRVPSTHKSWYFKSQPLSGTFTIGLSTLDPTEPSVEVAQELLSFLSDWGSVGARPQMGFGIFRLNETIQTNTLPELLNESKFWGNPEKKVSDGGMPALHNMFFARLGPRPGRPFQTNENFAIKQKLRNEFRDNEGLRHFVMGHIQAGSDYRMASKVFVSRPYEAGLGQEIRVWGWLPREENEYAEARGDALQRIYACLGTDYILKTWREIASKERDREFLPNPLTFFRSLRGYRA